MKLIRWCVYTDEYGMLLMNNSSINKVQRLSKNTLIRLDQDSSPSDNNDDDDISHLLRKRRRHSPPSIPTRRTVSHRSSISDAPPTSVLPSSLLPSDFTAFNLMLNQGGDVGTALRKEDRMARMQA